MLLVAEIRSIPEGEVEDVVRTSVPVRDRQGDVPVQKVRVKLRERLQCREVFALSGFCGQCSCLRRRPSNFTDPQFVVRSVGQHHHLLSYKSQRLLCSTPVVEAGRNFDGRFTTARGVDLQLGVEIGVDVDDEDEAIVILQGRVLQERIDQRFPGNVSEGKELISAVDDASCEDGGDGNVGESHLIQVFGGSLEAPPEPPLVPNVLDALRWRSGLSIEQLQLVPYRYGHDVIFAHPSDQGLRVLPILLIGHWVARDRGTEEDFRTGGLYVLHQGVPDEFPPFGWPATGPAPEEAQGTDWLFFQVRPLLRNARRTISESDIVHHQSLVVQLLSAFEQEVRSTTSELHLRLVAPGRVPIPGPGGGGQQQQW
mmetsp:Transcript_11273/g.24841  ORF Transcript_11273/g.24841 Transcript_11273/m.24841 type:complete len:369 (+) Transcript_11273:290-1396(+)